MGKHDEVHGMICTIYILDFVLLGVTRLSQKEKEMLRFFTCSLYQCDSSFYKKPNT